LVPLFINKLISEFMAGHVTEAICLTNACVNTAWFHALAAAASAICFPLGRIKFLEANGQEARNSPTLGQALTYLGPRAGEFADHFRPIGLVVPVQSVTRREIAA
jgi:hypothetical protein